MWGVGDVGRGSYRVSFEVREMGFYNLMISDMFVFLFYREDLVVLLLLESLRVGDFFIVD